MIRRQGDVLKMLQSEALTASFEPTAVECERVILSTSGEPYADDPDSPVLVLGDSFLRIYEQDEPGSAGFVAHLARELGRPIASIVNDGGASTRVRRQLARKPEWLKNKRLVIWEFAERDSRFGQQGWQNVTLPGASRPTSSSATKRATFK